MNVLVGCEESGIVREAFRARGHNAWSCDTEPASDNSYYHLQRDLLSVMNGCCLPDHGYIKKWDMLIAHPPCTFLSVSGLHWNKRGRLVDGKPRAELTEEALDFVRAIMGASADRIGLENPVSCISTRIRKPDQIIHPYMFGDDASKKTCLWLENLPPLRPTNYVAPRLVDGKPRWSNQTDSGQNKLPPSKDRAKLRSKTYHGIADAMADQWGSL